MVGMLARPHKMTDQGTNVYQIVYDDGDVREYTFVDGQKEFVTAHYENF